MQYTRLDHAPQRLAEGKQVLLAGNILKASRTHAIGQRLGAGRVASSL
jgi:hypothetical protein